MLTICFCLFELITQAFAEVTSQLQTLQNDTNLDKEELEEVRSSNEMLMNVCKLLQESNFEMSEALNLCIQQSMAQASETM